MPSSPPTDLSKALAKLPNLTKKIYKIDKHFDDPKDWVQELAQRYPNKIFRFKYAYRHSVGIDKKGFPIAAGPVYIVKSIKKKGKVHVEYVVIEEPAFTHFVEGSADLPAALKTELLRILGSGQNI